jgi:RNA-binding protein 8A
MIIILTSFSAIQGWTVFVSNLHPDITEDELRDHFADCGSVETVLMPLEQRTGFARGYALFAFRKRNHAETAVETLHNSNLMDRTISVTWCFADKR